MTLHYSNIDRQVDVSVETLTTLQDLPARTPQRGFYRNFMKRAFDISALVLTAPITVPIILTLAAIIWVKTGTSPFYAQDRVGRNGKHFTMWKLRTMVPNAEKALRDYLSTTPSARAEWNETQKLKNDPRITRFGRVLRKTSMDELPQLWNVFTGDMSIVGPRPMMVEQKVLYPGSDYYDMRPGITGFWQISDRNECSFAGRAAYDTKYNHEMSLVTDLAVVLGTVAVVLRGTGY